MESEESTTWKSYEDVARCLLDKIGDALGLERVEGKQSLVGESGTTWVIDGKGVRANDGAIVVIECRRYTTSRLKQEYMAGLAWRISDVGASGGIVVTPIGVQGGGQIVAKSAGIEVVHLDANSTTDYVLKFLNKVFLGVTSPVTITDTAVFEISRSDTP